jgi:thiol-disulfide isomerase/thioredoxin
VVAVAAVAAVVFTRDSDGDPAVEGTEETGPVYVTGTALPSGEGDADPAIGQAVPMLEGVGFDGLPVTISPDRGPMVVVFVAHWCPHCQNEVPRLTEHLDANSLPDGVSLLTVSTSASPDRPNYPPSAWLAREGWPGEVMVDSSDGLAAQAFGLSAFPYFVAVDADGQVVARTSGEISTEQFDQLVALALGTGN